MSFFKKYEDIFERLRLKMNKYRYEHSMGVMYTAAALAMRYELDIEKVMLAGLLHDCTKHFSFDENVALCEANSVVLSEFDKKNPKILHAITAPIIARSIFNINDTEILNAIRWHSTGKEDMTEMEKLIYVADFIEGGRYFKNDADVLNNARKMAFTTDLNITTAYILDRIIYRFKANNDDIHEASIKALEYYKPYLNKNI